MAAKHTSNPLREYVSKRNPKVTPEPAGTVRTRRASGSRKVKEEASKGELTFVVQKHRATRLHYDFRLELNGVLKSWAVPKGPSLNPSDKRLAVQVEDHPLDYAGFEGVIPKGQYGGGEVIVWDRGTYSVIIDHKPVVGRKAAEKSIQAGIEKGELSVSLNGSKLHGVWALARMHSDDADGKTNWLLIKKHDDFASDTDVTKMNQSVISGITAEALREASEGPKPSIAESEEKPAADIEVSKLKGAVKAKSMPETLRPMLAGIGDTPFNDDLWLFEPKLDGMRILAFVRKEWVSLVSRTGQPAAHIFPGLTKILGTSEFLQGHEALLDGEVVSLDSKGAPSFQLLQHRINLSRPADIARAETEVPVIYYLFDLLYLDGYDLRGVALEDRQRVLRALIQQDSDLKLVASFRGIGEAAYQSAIEHGFEGVIAKRSDSIYESGKRSKRWLKIKSTQSDDFVIGGYTRGTGNREGTFGALLVGQYNKDDQLQFMGHVGTGFDSRKLAEVLGSLEKLESKTCPFVTKPVVNAPAVWVKPELVAEIKFMHRTGDGMLRAPVFVTLRSDKPPLDATLEGVQHQTIESKGSEKRKSVMNSSDSTKLSPEHEALLKALSIEADSCALKLSDGEVRVTSLGKELWPASADPAAQAVTKRDLLKYYIKIADYLLQHLADRPLTLSRYPHGIGKLHFYQRHIDQELPKFVDTVDVRSHRSDEEGEYILCNNLATLLWLAQLADLELHTWFSRTTSAKGKSDADAMLDLPDFITFDLDPYIYSGREEKGAEPEFNLEGFAKTCEAALRLRQLLESLGLEPFVKTSGKTGLHVFAPIERTLTYDETRNFCETVCRHMLNENPALVTMQWKTAERTGRVFLDHNMNARGKTVASIYSPRAVNGAPVSVPLAWEELETTDPRTFNVYTAPDRLLAVGDLWDGILNARRDIKELIGARQI